MTTLRGTKRFKIHQRDGWRCHYCRLDVVVSVWHENPRRATLDHKHPKSKGGTDAADNLVTCCHRCNMEKGDVPYEMYRWFRHMLLRGHSRTELLEAIAEVQDEQLAPVAQMVEARP